MYQQVTLTEAERDQLRALAAALGVSVPRLLVESAFGRRETSTERKKLIVDLFEARRVLGTIANNVNQLARQANISGDLASEERLRQTLNEVDTVVAELRALTGAQR